jgi:alanyl-tRNA synthetase|tara:strand:+ start:4909 stop:7710 length:2802 start_codon:yes stop_codon:yes gene_type:complete
MKKNLSTNQIRSIFLEFFKEKGHEIVESGSLIPINDPSLLFTNSGMVPFKDMLLGVEKRGYTRATSSQRCLRVGGKHNDLDNVGYTARHHTFFEMLGNFSFGDYFKEEAIAFAWELLTKRYEIPPEKLWITVHKDDEESEKIWIDKIGVDPERISRLDDEENFWTMGDTGPCGPCSEIYYDHGDHIEGEPPTMTSDPGDRFIEIWNLVFTQFDRSKDGTLNPLPNPCVDTGMGLERMTAVLQGEHNNYNIDLFGKLVKNAAELIDEKNLENPSLRVIADHLRASSFLIADGIVPSNEGRGYVLRRIIRRALRHANKLGFKGTLLASMVPTLIEEMGDAHPLLAKESKIIKANLLQEEQQFSETLSQGMLLLESEIAQLDERVIPGDIVFKLYDTFGFPVDMTADFARERGLEVDLVEYEKLMEEQKERARSSNSFTSVVPESLTIKGSTEFIGYDQTNSDTKVVELINTSKESKSDKLAEDEEGVVILEQTPFYAESGGQIGDKGTLSGKGFRFDVLDTQKIGDHHGHFGVVKEGELKINSKVLAHIDEDFRNKVVPNHSATHLLQAALKKILGDHIEQKGSLVEESRLRFDFAHSKPVSTEEITKIEDLINLQIEKNTKSVTKVMTIEEATKKGAIAFFGEKYGEKVRVLDLGEGFSVELCGGTHVTKTGEIGLMKIINESGISAGVRRIEAVTGVGATLLLQELEQRITSICDELLVDVELIDQDKSNLDLIRDLQSKLNMVARELSCSEDQILKKIVQVKEEITALEKGLGKDISLISPASNSLMDAIKELKNLNTSLNNENKKKKSEGISSSASDLKANSVTVAGYNLITKSFENIDAKSLRDLADQLRNNEPNTIVTLVSITGDKIPLIVACSKKVEIDAREIMKHLVNQLGGSGGGRPDFAQGGADNSEDLEVALDSVADLVVSLSN